MGGDEHRFLWLLLQEKVNLEPKAGEIDFYLTTQTCITSYELHVFLIYMCVHNSKMQTHTYTTQGNVYVASGKTLSGFLKYFFLPEMNIFIHQLLRVCSIQA